MRLSPHTDCCAVRRLCCDLSRVALKRGNHRSCCKPHCCSKIHFSALIINVVHWLPGLKKTCSRFFLFFNKNVANWENTRFQFHFSRDIASDHTDNDYDLTSSLKAWCWNNIKWLCDRRVDGVKLQSNMGGNEQLSHALEQSMSPDNRSIIHMPMIFFLDLPNRRFPRWNKLR